MVLYPHTRWTPQVWGSTFTCKGEESCNKNTQYPLLINLPSSKFKVQTSTFPRSKQFPTFSHGHSPNTHGSSHLQSQNPNLHLPKTTDSPPHQSQPLCHHFPLPKLLFFPTQPRSHRRRYRRNPNLPPAQTPGLQARLLFAPSQHSQKRRRPHRRSQLNPLPCVFPRHCRYRCNSFNL